VEKIKAQEEERMKAYYAIAELLLDAGADIHSDTRDRGYLPRCVVHALSSLQWVDSF
jgi:hypothetical protein